MVAFPIHNWISIHNWSTSCDIMAIWGYWCLQQKAGLSVLIRGVLNLCVRVDWRKNILHDSRIKIQVPYPSWTADGNSVKSWEVTQSITVDVEFAIMLHETGKKEKKHIFHSSIPFYWFCYSLPRVMNKQEKPLLCFAHVWSHASS